MSTTLFFVGSIVCLTLLGCADTPWWRALTEPPRLNEPLKIHGEVTDVQRACILNAMAFLPKDVRNSVREFHLRSDLDHFEYTYLQTKRYAAGHNCTRGGRKVCIRPICLNYSIVWHEAAHVYTLTIKESGLLLLEWTKIAGNVYVDNYEAYDGGKISEGMLCWYGRKNSLEDIATWVEICLNYLYINKEGSVLSGQSECFKTDERYRLKLACLYKYGFFSEEDYKKLKPLFE